MKLLLAVLRRWETVQRNRDASSSRDATMVRYHSMVHIDLYASILFVYRSTPVSIYTVVSTGGVIESALVVSQRLTLPHPERVIE